MIRSSLVVALALGVAPLLNAQEKPAPAVQQAISATWKLDAAHSDVIPDNPLQGARGLGAVSGGNSSHGGGGGGGGGRGGTGGGGSGASSASLQGLLLTANSTRADTARALVICDSLKSAGTPAAAAALASAGSSACGGGDGGQRNANPNLQLVMAAIAPGAGIVVAANDSVVAIATANMLKANPNAVSNWKTDGKKHQDAQMDGSIIESESGWKDGVLTIAFGVVGVGTFTREFKPSKDGKTLELKETILVGRQKAEYKLTFNR